MQIHPGAEHVWVSLTGVWREDQVPGLLLAWRCCGSRGWEGWVISAQPGIDARAEGPYVGQAWLPATAIQPTIGPVSGGCGPTPHR